MRQASAQSPDQAAKTGQAMKLCGAGLSHIAPAVCPRRAHRAPRAHGLSRTRLANYPPHSARQHGIQRGNQPMRSPHWTIEAYWLRSVDGAYPEPGLCSRFARSLCQGATRRRVVFYISAQNCAARVKPGYHILCVPAKTRRKAATVFRCDSSSCTGKTRIIAPQHEDKQLLQRNSSMDQGYSRPSLKPPIAVYFGLIDFYLN